MHHKQSLFLKPLEDLTKEQQQERERIASHLPELEAGNPGLFSLSAYSHLQWVCAISKNNRTKTMMRQAYGYRNFHNLRLRILMERGV